MFNWLEDRYSLRKKTETFLKLIRYCAIVTIFEFLQFAKNIIFVLKSSCNDRTRSTPG